MSTRAEGTDRLGNVLALVWALGSFLALGGLASVADYERSQGPVANSPAVEAPDAPAAS